MAVDITPQKVTSLPDALAAALGYVNWNYHPALASNSSSLTSQVVYLQGIWLPYGTPVSNVVLTAITAGVGTAPTGFFVGLATPAGVMVTQSANLNASANLTATGPKAYAVTAYTPNPGDSATGLYYIVTLQNGAFGTTNVAFARTSTLPQPIAALGTGSSLGGTGATTAQAALPANGAGIVGGIVQSNPIDLFAGCS